MKTSLFCLAASSAFALAAFGQTAASDTSRFNLRFVSTTDAVASVKQQLGSGAAAAIRGANDRDNSLSLDATQSMSAQVRGLLVSLDKRPAQIVTHKDGWVIFQPIHP